MNILDLKPAKDFAKPKGPLTQEHKEKLSIALKGRKHSIEHIKKRIAYKRKPEKWPHGYKCKCKPCLKAKSQDIMKRRKEKLALQNEVVL